MMYIKIDFLDKDALLPDLVANRKMAGVFFICIKYITTKQLLIYAILHMVTFL